MFPRTQRHILSPDVFYGMAVETNDVTNAPVAIAFAFIKGL
jgi:hypothetical protein